MIIAAQQNDVIKSGFDNSKKATINQDKLGKLQYLLTKGLYSDATSAVIVEWVNNGVDSVVQSGKNPVECPVIVKIGDNKLIVEDKGIGLNQEEFENVCMNYLTSTKEEDNTQIGSFGIGMKSFMALDRGAIFTCRKDGIERKFMAYAGAEFMEYDLLYEKPTTEENGVICEIALNGWSEQRDFETKAKQKLAYYDTVVLVINGQIVNNQILRSEDWQYSANANYNTIHLCLKDVLYKIDYEKLGIQPIHIPIALRFDLSCGLIPTPSREQLLWNSHAITLVKDKIAKVATWFINKYNESVPDERELLEAWNSIISSDMKITLEKEEFRVNNLVLYSTIQPKPLKIKGISIKKPSYYYENSHDFNDEYECLVDYANYNSVWKVKHIKNHTNLTNLDKKHILVNSVPTGKLKRFLLEKYKRNFLFIKKVQTRGLRIWDNSWGGIGYKNILNLENEPKSNWRALIQEWQFVENQFKSLIIDETKCENSVEFQEWCAKEKELAKYNRVSNSGNYKTLNKKEGQITIAIARKALKGNTIVFEKSVVNIDKLDKTGKLYIYQLENKEYNLRVTQLFTLYPNWIICTIGKNEAKKIKNLHNFMELNEFMSEKSKPFRRMATAFRIQQLSERFDRVTNIDELGIIDDKMLKVVDKIRTYATENLPKRYDVHLIEAIINIAKEFNTWDNTITSDIKLVEEWLDLYDFLPHLQYDKYAGEEEKKRYKTTVLQYLYHKKFYHNKLEGFDIVLVPTPVAVVEEKEELVLEEQN